MAFYRAIVIDNNDPENSGRVRLRLPQMLGMDATTWAVPMDRGMLTDYPPAVGDVVWAGFEGDDFSYPIYLPSITSALRTLKAANSLV